MTRQRFLAKQQCAENVIVVDALDVTRNRAVSLDCACSAEIVYCKQVITSRICVTIHSCSLFAMTHCQLAVQPRRYHPS